MRAAFLTGREIWKIGEAGTHASSFPIELPVFTRQLTAAGYHVGMTGKGWGPGKAIGWEHNPAGQNYSSRTAKAPKGVSTNDYAANFDDFLSQRREGQPFCFWFGSHEPHRNYERGIGSKHGIDPSKVTVPAFLPDNEVIRNDIADYLFEIQWFDKQLGRMIESLEASGELANTLVIVTSDNGMPFPAAKANLYEAGIHMPLAIEWPSQIPAGQVNRDLVSLIDVTRTLLDAAGIDPLQADQMDGFSLLPSLRAKSPDVAWPRKAVFSGRERHSSSRYDSLGYPCRCIRTDSHLYIRNFKPERWPAGAPVVYQKVVYDDKNHIVSSTSGPPRGGFHDIDDGPALDHIRKLDDASEAGKYLRVAG